MSADNSPSTPRPATPTLGSSDVAAHGDVASPLSPTSPNRPLPSDLPTSLDDRRTFDNYFPGQEEFYDDWTGSSAPIAYPTAKSNHTKTRSLTGQSDLKLDSTLGLQYNGDEENDIQARLADNERGFMNSYISSVRNQKPGATDGADDGDSNDDAVARDEKLSADEKKKILQKALNMAASNGDTERVRKLVGSRPKEFVDVNKPDDEGTVPLIYASCFGHEGVVSVLLDAGANVDEQDRNGWSALMWSVMNRHKIIARALLDHGANGELRSSSGGSAWDFVQPGSDLAQYLREGGYSGGMAAGAGFAAMGGFEGDDFYSASGGFGDDRFEEEAAESMMKRRMLMEESAANLEVDLSTLGFDEAPDFQGEDLDQDDEEEFIWERCVGDQMFVFQDDKMDLILDTIITNMTPQRTPAQKPVPANLIFLMARYAHYHMTGSLLEDLLTRAMDLINDVVERHQWDMTMLAFWISNATLLLHYLKKDAGLVQATSKYQLELAELVNETFILIIRDAERRMNKVLDNAMLDHETIPGLSDVEFQGEWNVFKSKPKVVEEDPSKRFRPPSPKRRAQISPRNITSLLSSTLFVLDLYDVHSVITAQILAQLLYWIGAELFNRIMTTRKYLSRTKAMQIRMNVSAVEDWARANNRTPEHYEHGSTTTSGQMTVDAARRHLAPIVQLLQWLQCFSSTGEDHEVLLDTLMQLQRLSPMQLVHAVKNYRYEVGEKGLPKAHMKFLQQLQKGSETLIRRPVTPLPDTDTPGTPSSSTPQPDTNTKAERENNDKQAQHEPSSAPSKLNIEPTTDPPDRNRLLLDQSLMLPFSLPTSTDMLITYGAGIGGVNRERARKYIPTVPTEVLSKLNLDGDAGVGSTVRGREGSVGTVARGWRGTGNGEGAF
ncbi:hypothetical protein PMZ80_007771 [Knufia obscura]|uniref:Dilute domain-containing protein n=2 Tax=Knufia TaxID=430999 RepID=A0AAN8INL6_9EURO|nr:hypothetical protein PMZ80_007771 [Knufia obscura]KAK5954307.1 hypothetical protein OHC33_004880 [Knufia fluminis]